MFHKSEFTSIGKFIKTHGNNGDIVLKLDPSIIDYIEEIEFLFADIENGLVPFEITKSSVRNHEMVQFSLLNLESEESARNLIGTEVFIESELIQMDEEETPPEFLIDQYTVYDKEFGLIGKVNSLISIDKNPLLQILVGKKEILIPFNESFIIEIDNSKKEIQMELPEGLLDINL